MITMCSTDVWSIGVTMTTTRLVWADTVPAAAAIPLCSLSTAGICNHIVYSQLCGQLNVAGQTCDTLLPTLKSCGLQC